MLVGVPTADVCRDREEPQDAVRHLTSGHAACRLPLPLDPYVCMSPLLLTKGIDFTGASGNMATTNERLTELPLRQ